MTAVTAGNGAEFHWQGSRGRWAVSVPVPDAEHRHLYCDGPEHRGQLFEIARLRVFARLIDRPAEFRLAGPNIRQDGTPGAYTLAKQITCEDAARDYPETWAAAQEALTELIRLVQGDADLACAEIARARSFRWPEDPVLAGDDTCTASSWGGQGHKPYGPGGYNRCVVKGPHTEHTDDFGNVFLFNPDAAGGNADPRVRVLRHHVPQAAVSSKTGDHT